MAWTTFHHRSSYECGECKEGSVHLTLTITIIFCRCQQTVQLPPVPKPIQLKQNHLSKNGQKMFERKLYNNYVFCVVYCLLCCLLFVVYHSTVLCQQSNANCFQQNLFICLNPLTARHFFFTLSFGAGQIFSFLIPGAG